MSNAALALTRRVERLERGRVGADSAAQLAHSSIEDGSITGYDGDDNPTVRIDEQHDGTHTAVSLSGPTPPVPAAPKLTPTVGGLSIRINGKFAGDAVSPMDFKQFETHAATGNVERVAATNLITNPSFENGAGGWSGNSSTTIEHDDTESRYGSGSLKVTIDGYGYAISDKFELKSTTETIAMSIKSTGDLAGSDFGLYYYGSDGVAHTARASVPVTTPGDWVDVTHTFDLPADTVTIRATLWPNKASDTYWIDGILVGQSTPYFDGDTPDDDEYSYRWTGERGSSTSEKYVPIGAPHDPATLVAATSAESGASIVVNCAEIAEYTVWLVARTQSGKLSDASDVATGTPLPLVDGAELDKKLADAHQAIDLAAARLKALGAAVDAGDIPESVAAKIGDFIQLNVSQLVATDAAIDTAVINKLFADIFTAHKISTDLLEANAIDGMKITGALFQTDDADVTGTKIGPDGYTAYGADGDVVFSVSRTGDVVAHNITAEGVYESADYVEAESGIHFDSEQAQVQNLNVIESIGADDGSFGTLNIGGVDVDPETISDAAPRGLIASGSISGASKDSKIIPASSSDDHPMLRFDIGNVEGGRHYLISFHWSVTPAASGAYRMALRYTTDGSGVTKTTAIMDGGMWRYPVTAYQQSGYLETIYSPGSDQFLKTGLYVYAASGQFQMKFTDNNYKPEVKCLDLGRTNGNSDQLRQASYESDSGGGDDSGGDKTRTKSKHTQHYKATWSASWDHGPSHKRSDGDRWARQGSLYVGHAGSCIGFDDAKIRADLKGVPTSDIESITVKYRCAHTYSSGGADLQMTWHNAHGEPSSYPSITRMTKGDRNNAKAGNWYTEKLDTGFAAALRDDTAKGIGWDSNAGNAGYAYMQGYHNAKGKVNAGRPEITIVYKK